MLLWLSKFRKLPLIVDIVELINRTRCGKGKIRINHIQSGFNDCCGFFFLYAAEVTT